MKEGYSEHKAFQMIESEISEILRKYKDEQRILRGVASETSAYSYIDRFQKVAELESELKMKRLERDMPKYLRAQRNYIKQFDTSIQNVENEARAALGMNELESNSVHDEYVYQRESIEDLLHQRQDYQAEQKFEKYQPVLYEIIKDPKDLADKESLHETHDKFLERSEELLRLHHQRSHIHDGLKHLTDQEVIRKVREAPTKLKRSAKSFLNKLRKLGVELDHNGDLDLSALENKNERKWIQKNESLVRLTLMQADLEFEYPQKIEKMLIKADILEMVNKEEEKLEFAEFAKEAEEARKKVLTYEEYF